MHALKNVKNTVAKEQEKDSNSQKDNLLRIYKKPPEWAVFYVLCANIIFLKFYTCIKPNERQKMTLSVGPINFSKTTFRGKENNAPLNPAQRLEYDEFAKNGKIENKLAKYNGEPYNGILEKSLKNGKNASIYFIDGKLVLADLTDTNANEVCRKKYSNDCVEITRSGNPNLSKRILKTDEGIEIRTPNPIEPYHRFEHLFRDSKRAISSFAMPEECMGRYYVPGLDTGFLSKIYSPDGSSKMIIGALDLNETLDGLVVKRIDVPTGEIIDETPFVE